mgnify:CR=1 FL=1
MYEESGPFGTDDCQAFCFEISEDFDDVSYNDEFCCDYESWDDGSFNCYVYEGSAQVL